VKKVINNYGEALRYTEDLATASDNKCLSDFRAHIYINAILMKFSPSTDWPKLSIYDVLKEALRGRRFTSGQEVKEAVHAWLAAQPKTFFSEGIRKLVQRWTK
jgi:hypothetical protein